jgi:fluoride exporter
MRQRWILAFRADTPLRSRPVREQLAIFTGGCLGALARAGVAHALPPDAATWPWATLLVNVAGAALLGWAVTRPWEHAARVHERRLFIGTGFCGALTTFSTFQLELVQLLDDGRWPLVLAYVAVSLVAGLGGLLVATNLAQRSRPAR